MSHFIRQNEVNKANELLKVQQPLLESSSGMGKLRCITNTAHSPVTKTTVMGKCPFTRIFSDREYQLTEPWSAKIVDEVVKEVQNAVYWFLRSCRKTYFCQNF